MHADDGGASSAPSCADTMHNGVSWPISKATTSEVNNMVHDKTVRPLAFFFAFGRSDTNVVSIVGGQALLDDDSTTKLLTCRVAKESITVSASASTSVMVAEKPDQSSMRSSS